MSTSTLSATPHRARAQPAWAASPRGPGRTRSTCATSSSATTRRTTATPRSWPARPRARPRCGQRLDRDVPGRARARRLRRRRAHARRRSPSHAPGYIDRGQRADRRPADRRAAQARDHAERRLADGRERARDLRLRARPDGRRRSSPSTARPTTTASSTSTRRDVRAARSSHIITGLPDAYGRGRIIGDYRRVAALRRRRPDRGQEARTAPSSTRERSTEDVIRDREENAEQIRALRRAQDDGRVATATTSPARRRPRREAVQWLYFAYLGAVKEQNGAAMSLGRTSTFLDVYLQRDLDAGRAHRGSRPRSSSTTSSSSCGSCGSCAPRSTTRCSPATRPGSPSRSAAWARTAGRWSPGPRSGTCRPCTTWARRPSRT